MYASAAMVLSLGAREMRRSLAITALVLTAVCLAAARPAAARGRFIEMACVTRTMGVALKLAV